jgi:hypothetical protein
MVRSFAKTIETARFLAKETGCLYGMATHSIENSPHVANIAISRNMSRQKFAIRVDDKPKDEPYHSTKSPTIAPA